MWRTAGCAFRSFRPQRFSICRLAMPGFGRARTAVIVRRLAATANAVQEGSVGAGAGATLGKYLGFNRAMKSGVGSASTTTADGTIIAALVVANPLGDVVDPANGKDRRRRSQSAGQRLRRCPHADSNRVRLDQHRAATRRSVVIATNATLTKAQVSLLAQLAGDGVVRASGRSTPLPTVIRRSRWQPAPSRASQT